MEAKNGEHPIGDIGQLILLVLFLIVWVADSFLLRKSTFLSAPIPLYGRLVFLAIALAAAVYFVRSGHKAVNHGQPSAGLVSSGAFRYIRHPLYLGSLLFYLGLAVSTASLFSLILLVLIFFFYDYIAHYEEQVLERRFGQEYKSYKKRTGKWLPKFGKRI
jgi:protein-S-isoprenylcysteine O-methyltransferase Ste14